MIIHLDNTAQAKHLLDGRTPYPACIKRGDCQSCAAIAAVQRAIEEEENA
jgi:hypothetical protein